MELKLSITGTDGAVKASAAGTDMVRLVYQEAYCPGDVLHLEADAPGFVWAKMEDSIPDTLAWLAKPYHLTVPFGEKRANYSPKSFSGDSHFLQVRAAHPKEVQGWRNLALNPLDHGGNSGLFPHAKANIETRGESVFAARNAIDGCYANSSHGIWPYQSWGINCDPQAELTLDFGRPVRIDRLVFTIRADFPHDSWWDHATVTFDNEMELRFSLEKSAGRQCYDIDPITVRWLKFHQLHKVEDDPSPFPALTQIEVWGTEA